MRDILDRLRRRPANRQAGRCRGLAAALLMLALLPPAAADEPLAVVATFSILGDLTVAVGGERVAVTTLVGPGGDGHVYTPTPTDARALNGAQLFVVNGLSFEGWMERLIDAAGYEAPIVVATDGITPRRAEDGSTDPHAWQDPANGRRYVENIRDGLIAVDPAGAAGYRARADAYLAALDATAAQISESLAAIPPEYRRVVTSHDAFGYFGDTFGIDFIAPVGVSTENEASAADVAALIRQIRADAIPAVFVESISDPRLLEQIRRETGTRLGGTLYSDALSPPDGPAATYLDMLEHNAATLAAALAPAAVAGDAAAASPVPAIHPGAPQ
jgi:zinc/manganese transport system substrate-binding protein